MAGKILLDSNIVIDLFRGNESVIKKLSNVSLVYVPVIVLGELYYGAYKSNQTEERIIQVEGLEQKVVLLDCTKRTARIYGKIKDELRQKGKPIPENDIWIAAIAREHQLVLATRDKHFDEVKGLRLEKWK